VKTDPVSGAPVQPFSFGTFLKNVGRNSGALTIAGIAGKFATFVVFLLANRSLPQVEFGAFALILATSEIIRVIAVFGVDTVSLRALARDERRHGEIVSTAIVLKMLTSLAASVVFAGAALLLHFSSAMWVGPAILMVDFFLSAGVQSLVTYHQASVRADRAAPAILLAALGNVATGLVAARLHAPMPFYLAGLPVGNAIGLLALLLITRRWVRPSVRVVRRATLLRFAMVAWPLAGTAVVVLLYFRINTIMLAQFVGLAAVASYAAAYKLSEAFLLVAAAVSGTTLPVLADALRGGPNREGVRAYQASILVSLATAVPFALLVTLAGRFLLVQLFGPTYAGSAYALAILGWATVLMAVNVQTTNALVALDRERLVFGVAGVNLAVNIVANLVLIPRMSFNGAALATLITEAGNLGMQAALVWILLRRPGSAARLSRPGVTHE
jgi:O-antigen/teichoic acid export membrane protein